MNPFPQICIFFGLKLIYLQCIFFIIMNRNKNTMILDFEETAGFIVKWPSPAWYVAITL